LYNCVDGGLFPGFTSAASDKKLASNVPVTGEFTIASTHMFTHHHTTILSQLQQAPPAKRRRVKEPAVLVVEPRRSKRLQKL